MYHSLRKYSIANNEGCKVKCWLFFMSRGSVRYISLASFLSANFYYCPSFSMLRKSNPLREEMMFDAFTVGFVS